MILSKTSILKRRITIRPKERQKQKYTAYFRSTSNISSERSKKPIETISEDLRLSMIRRLPSPPTSLRDRNTIAVVEPKTKVGYYAQILIICEILRSKCDDNKKEGERENKRTSNILICLALLSASGSHFPEDVKVNIISA